VNASGEFVGNDPREHTTGPVMDQDFLSAALQSVTVDSTRALARTHAAASPSVVAGVELGPGRDGEILLSAQELSSPSSLEHVLAREIWSALGASGTARLDASRLRHVLNQAQESMCVSPHAWSNHTSAARLFQIGTAHADAAAEASARVYDALQAVLQPSGAASAASGSAAGSSGASDAKGRATAEAVLEALSSCARLHAWVALAPDVSASLGSLSAQAAELLLKTVLIRIECIYYIYTYLISRVKGALCA